MHTENSRLRRIDDRCTEQRTEHSSIADRECSSIHVFDGDRPFLGLDEQRCPIRHGDEDVPYLVAEFSDGSFDVSKAHLLDITKDRYDQTLFEHNR